MLASCQSRQSRHTTPKTDGSVVKSKPTNVHSEICRCVLPVRGFTNCKHTHNRCKIGKTPGVDSWVSEGARTTLPRRGHPVHGCMLSAWTLEVEHLSSIFTPLFTYARTFHNLTVRGYTIHSWESAENRTRGTQGRQPPHHLPPYPIYSSIFWCRMYLSTDSSRSKYFSKSRPCRVCFLTATTSPKYFPMYTVENAPSPTAGPMATFRDTKR